MWSRTCALAWMLPCADALTRRQYRLIGQLGRAACPSAPGEDYETESDHEAMRRSKWHSSPWQLDGLLRISAREPMTPPQIAWWVGAPCGQESRAERTTPRPSTGFVLNRRLDPGIPWGRTSKERSFHPQPWSSQCRSTVEDGLPRPQSPRWPSTDPGPR